jgi:prepilin-type N-terminal cleavage/methylation domain-containing protein
MLCDMPRVTPRGGFTLLELLVVLVLMGVAAALAAPALLRARPNRLGLNELIPAAREAAARRSEIVYLRIDGGGHWRMDGASSSPSAPLAAGRVDPFAGLPLTLDVSPTGVCAFDLRSAAAARVIQLDPLTCDIRTP